MHQARVKKVVTESDTSQGKQRITVTFILTKTQGSAVECIEVSGNRVYSIPEPPDAEKVKRAMWVYLINEGCIPEAFRTVTPDWQPLEAEVNAYGRIECN